MHFVLVIDSYAEVACLAYLPSLRASLVHHQAVHVFLRARYTPDQRFSTLSGIFETRVGVQARGAVAWVAGADNEALAFQCLRILGHDHVQSGFRRAVDHILLRDVSQDSVVLREQRPEAKLTPGIRFPSVASCSEPIEDDVKARRFFSPFINSGMKASAAATVPKTLVS